jgi:phosphatidylethanolamine/phosphatidyl-N-methylethanolamine N-methyltransferase
VSSEGQSFWERNAARYDRSMRLFGGPLPRAIELAVAAVDGRRRVLEIACGTGLFSEALAPVVGELLSTDYAEAMVGQARARAGTHPNARFSRRDLYALGEPHHSFDAVVAANVLHLLPDLEGGLRAMREVLAPGGLLVVPTYCHAEHWRSRAASAALAVVSFPGQRRFTLESLCQAVTNAGLDVEQTESIPGVLPIGVLVARA